MANDLLKLKNDFHALVSEFPFTTTPEVALIVGWLNDAQRDAAKKTKLLSKYDITTFTSAVGVMTVDLTSLADFIEVNRQGGVTYDGKRIDYVTIDELDYTNVKWRAWGNGTPSMYTIESMTNLLLLVPPSQAGKVVGVHYHYTPPDLSADDNKPFDAKAHLYGYHDLLLLYAIGLAKFAKGMFATRELALGEYTARLNAVRAELVPEEAEKTAFKIDPFRAKIIKARFGIS